MRTYAIFVESMLSGNTVQVDCYLTPGEIPKQHAVHVADHGEVIGHIVRLFNRQGPFLPVVHDEEQGELVLLRNMHRLLDAMGEIVQYLADRNDPRLDLAWREVAG